MHQSQTSNLLDLAQKNYENPYPYNLSIQKIQNPNTTIFPNNNDNNKTAVKLETYLLFPLPFDIPRNPRIHNLTINPLHPLP